MRFNIKAPHDPEEKVWTVWVTQSSSSFFHAAHLGVAWRHVRALSGIRCQSQLHDEGEHGARRARTVTRIAGMCNRLVCVGAAHRGPKSRNAHHKTKDARPRLRTLRSHSSVEALERGTSATEKEGRYDEQKDTYTQSQWDIYKSRSESNHHHHHHQYRIFDHLLVACRSTSRCRVAHKQLKIHSTDVHFSK
jgi:hypothetical protein